MAEIRVTAFTTLTFKPGLWYCPREQHELWARSGSRETFAGDAVKFAYMQAQK
jgi:hypothetical protein